MGERPNLNKTLDAKKFCSYYYLKEELVDFCRREGLQNSGGKLELTDRIAHYLETGEKLNAKKPSREVTNVGEITKETLIEKNIVCSEIHREFFCRVIGSGFTFNVLFQKWLKENAGKTYSDAVIAYHQIMKDKKKGTTKIDKQFEYNTYIRDFFLDNQGKKLDQAIRCWNYKKSLPGHNKYESGDLSVLAE